MCLYTLMVLYDINHFNTRTINKSCDTLSWPVGPGRFAELDQYTRVFALVVNWETCLGNVISKYMYMCIYIFTEFTLVFKWENSRKWHIYVAQAPFMSLPAQRPVTRSFDVFFDLHPNKRLSKHSRGWWFETPSRPLWRHCNGYARSL